MANGELTVVDMVAWSKLEEASVLLEVMAVSEESCDCRV